MPRKKTSKKTVTSRKTKKPVTAKSTKAPQSAKITKTVKERQTVTKPLIVEHVVEEPQSMAGSNQSTAAKKKSFRVRKVYVITAIIIVILGILLYIYRGLFVAAVVNGQPISRLSVVQAAEKQSGKQALDTLVRNALIQQEANQEHVTVSDQEVDNQLKTVKNNLAKQGQDLNQVLQTQGMTQDDLRQLVRMDLLVQKMVGKNIKITDKQVNDYIAANKSSLPQNESGAQLRNDVKNQLQQQELNQKVQTWLNDLESKAHITYFVQY